MTTIMEKMEEIKEQAEKLSELAGITGGPTTEPPVGTVEEHDCHAGPEDSCDCQKADFAEMNSPLK